MRKAPVTRCSGFDAIAYSQWYSEKNGDGVYRLPTSAEWENAAVTPNRYKYPWGNENKILKSLRTSDRVDRCRFPIDFVKEDVAESGIRNTYGGLELVLDTYVFADEKYKNLQSENPLIMDNYINVISSRGSIDDYNDLYNESGRFFPYMGDFEYPSPTSFRLVKDVGTVFNKNDIDECFYFINRGITDSDIVDVFEHPNEASSILISTKCKDFFILFKSTTNSAFYKVCFVDKIENDKDSWYYGWMRESDIELTNKKWYEK